MTDLTPEQSTAVSEYVRKSNAFSTGESHDCPLCGAAVTGAKLYQKIEPEVYSLYVLPCNCRLGLWSKAPDWIEDVRMITLDEQDDASDLAETRARMARWNATVRGEEK